mmetsp:Transcript_37429/g.105693  ORF Transcript_37429/g.105693 Transcript_37429/m.105693 type:complete len:298 (-) Transcript_37429:387-1280(-)
MLGEEGVGGDADPLDGVLRERADQHLEVLDRLVHDDLALHPLGLVLVRLAQLAAAGRSGAVARRRLDREHAYQEGRALDHVAAVGVLEEHAHGVVVALEADPERVAVLHRRGVVALEEERDVEEAELPEPRREARGPRPDAPPDAVVRVAEPVGGVERRRLADRPDVLAGQGQVAQAGGVQAERVHEVPETLGAHGVDALALVQHRLPHLAEERAVVDRVGPLLELPDDPVRVHDPPHRLVAPLALHGVEQPVHRRLLAVAHVALRQPGRVAPVEHAAEGADLPLLLPLVLVQDPRV